MIRNFKLFILSVIASVSMSCDSWLTVQPDTMVIDDVMFSNAAGFRDASLGVYILMAQAYDYNSGLVSSFVEHLACQWEVINESKESYINIHEYYDDRVDDESERVFKSAFKVIANNNLLIENLRNQDKILRDYEYNSYMGQALMLRAYIHFDLLRLYGPIPSSVAENKKYLPYAEKFTLKRHEYITFRQFVDKLFADLDEAERLLFINFFPQGKSQYANYYACLALKARIYQWLGNDEKALEYAEKAIKQENEYGLTSYKLATYGDIQSGKGTAFNCENIFSMILSKKGGSSLSTYVYERYLLDELFEMSGSDTRLNQWETYEQDAEINPDFGEKYRCTKYSVKTESTDTTSADEVSLYVPLIRLSEMYFIAMECNSDIEKSREYYKTFCEARSISPKPFTNKMELREILMLEYRREFIAEGQLFYFYKRHLVQSMPRCRRGCGETAYVLPIPKAEFQLTE